MIEKGILPKTTGSKGVNMIKLIFPVNISQMFLHELNF